jgi:hypoxia up-regulated 1
LQFNLEREEFEAANKAFFARVVTPANQALEKAGLTIEDIDDLEVLGGGVRVPMVTETLQAALGKEPSVHLNGDEAMCFGAAFIASNSSADFKVKQIFLTQHPQHDVTVRISPLDPKEATSREEQLAEGVEESDLIKYEQEFKLFNASDYVGKSKALNINYNRDMKIELLKQEGDKLELLDAFLLKGVKTSLESEIKNLKDEQERARKKKEKERAKAKKESNDTADASKKEEDAPKEEPKEAESEEAGPIPTPKIKISVEYSRSGYMQVTKAMAGSYRIDVEHVRKESQLTRDQVKLAQQRLRWHKNRDEAKIRTDSARNSYETLIYKLREWLREDDNAPFV